MIGLKFNNTHSTDLKVYARNIDRSLLPSRRRDDYLIQGRDGTLDYNNNTYDTRIIEMEIAVFPECDISDPVAFREKIREVAKWLSGIGYLIFDDEPDKAYWGKVYEAVAINSYEAEDWVSDPFEAGLMQVSFECQPFAETPNYRQVVRDNFENETTLTANVKGTQDTCCLIKIVNTGTTDIKGINIVRQADI